MRSVVVHWLKSSIVSTPGQLPTAAYHSVPGVVTAPKPAADLSEKAATVVGKWKGVIVGGNGEETVADQAVTTAGIVVAVPSARMSWSHHSELNRWKGGGMTKLNCHMRELDRMVRNIDYVIV